VTRRVFPAVEVAVPGPGPGRLPLLVGACVALALAVVGAARGEVAAAANPCATGSVARTPSYVFSLVIGPREAMYLPSEVQARNIKKGQVMLGGEMSMIGPVPAGKRIYNLEVHVCTKSGAVVTKLKPAILVREATAGRATPVPAAIMAGVAEGIRDYHYGNDVVLTPGARVTVTVSVEGERAVLRATVPKRS
jgi:hypothetical protein